MPDCPSDKDGDVPRLVFVTGNGEEDPGEGEGCLSGWFTSGANSCTFGGSSDRERLSCCNSLAIVLRFLD